MKNFWRRKCVRRVVFWNVEVRDEGAKPPWKENRDDFELSFGELENSLDLGINPEYSQPRSGQ